MDIPASYLSAERILGRLLEATEQEGLGKAWRFDAMRREALASCRIEGYDVTQEAMAISLINLAMVPVMMRTDARKALTCYRAAEVVEYNAIRVLTQEMTVVEGEEDLEFVEDQRLSDRTSRALNETNNLVRSSRKAIDDIEEFLASQGLTKDPEPEEEEEPEEVPGTEFTTELAEPLTLPWLIKVWEVTCGDLRRDDALILTGVPELAERAIAMGGLPGVALAAHLLHQPGALPEFDDDRYLIDARSKAAISTGSFAAAGPLRFARIVAAAVARRACDTKAPLWLSEMLYRSKLYGNIDRIDEARWLRDCGDVLLDHLTKEIERVREIEKSLEDWEFRLRHKRSNSRTGEVAALMREFPAVTAVTVQRRTNMTHRGVQLVLNDMHKAGLITDVANRRYDRLWLANFAAPHRSKH
jgi:hypothetical protein